MLHNLKVNVVIPTLARVGTMTGTTLIGLGLNAEASQQLGLFVTAGGLFVFDYIVDWLARRK